jgi:hypothetical protein
VRKTVLVAIGLVLAGLCWSTAHAAERSRRGSKRVKAKIVPRTPLVVGTITYDTGVNAGFHPDAPVAGQNRFVGNRFNSALGAPLLMTGMVSMLTAYPAQDGVQSVSIATAPTTMDTAMVIVFLNAPMMGHQFNSVTFSPNVTVGPDFLGLFLGAFSVHQPAGLVGMSDMGTKGQGYHAIEGFYDRGLATMIQPVPGRNAMLRVTVDILVPVELMDFEVR